MFERFTDRARLVVVLGQEEARRLGHSYIGTEHILLGLIREGKGAGARVLERLSIPLPTLRSEVEAIIGSDKKEVDGHIPFTPRAKKVLELSLREALGLNHSYIGSEHILLGLIREGEGVAAQVLMRHGADLSTTRRWVLELLASPEQQSAVIGPPTTVSVLDDGTVDLTSTTEPYVAFRSWEAAVELEGPQFGLLTDECKGAIVAAVAAAERAQEHFVTSGHLLLGLLAQGDASVGAFLSAHGVTTEGLERTLGKDQANTSRALREVNFDLRSVAEEEQAAFRARDLAQGGRLRQVTKALSEKRSLLEADAGMTDRRTDSLFDDGLPLDRDAIEVLRRAMRFTRQVSPAGLMLALAVVQPTAAWPILADAGVTAADVRRHLIGQEGFASSKIFLSYRQHDTEADAGRLYDSLIGEFGQSQVFRDVTSIPAGHNLEDAIRRAMQDSSVLIALVGPNWAGLADDRRQAPPGQVDWVAVELDMAAELGVTILPVLVRGGQMPRPDQLPPSLASFAKTNAARLDHRNWTADLRELINTLMQIL